MIYQTKIQTPIGPLTARYEDNHIISLRPTLKTDYFHRSTHLSNITKKQLQSYFNGKLEKFDLPVNPTGTTFQKSVWKTIQQIRYGQTTCYRDIASQIHKPLACRAVGQALNRNPLMIIIPCHRVIKANRIIQGYAYPQSIKKWLLHHEATFS